MAVPVVGTNSLNTYIFLVFLIMIKSNYHVDISQFGKILVEVMSKYHITYSSLYHTTGVSKEYISAVWGGQADYHHSIYVRIVNGLEGWIPEKDYPDIRDKLIRASFGDEV